MERNTYNFTRQYYYAIKHLTGQRQPVYAHVSFLEYCWLRLKGYTVRRVSSQLAIRSWDDFVGVFYTFPHILDVVISKE